MTIQFEKCQHMSCLKMRAQCWQCLKCRKIEDCEKELEILLSIRKCEQKVLGLGWVCRGRVAIFFAKV